MTVNPKPKVLNREEKNVVATERERYLRDDVFETLRMAQMRATVGCRD